MNHLVIDGYNLILADIRLSKLMNKDPFSAREKLVNEIQQGIGKSSKVTLVFDGKFLHQKELISQNFEVQFSPRGESADEVIKEIIGRAWNRRVITVVTNDLSIIAYAKECGSRTMKSEEFLRLLRTKEIVRKENDGKNPLEKPEHVTNEDFELLKKWRKK
jgi:predicted RNA-binding protein with PIN domain